MHLRLSRAVLTPRALLVISVLFVGLIVACSGLEAASAEPPHIKVTRPGELGIPLLLVVRVEDEQSARPIPRATLFIYQTDRDGYYDRSSDGREQGPHRARLHATGVTDANGAVVFETIVPGSYPGSSIFRHIHYRLEAQGYPRKVREIVLDEEPIPTEGQKRMAVENGDIVAKRVKGPNGVSEIRVTLKLRHAKEN